MVHYPVRQCQGRRGPGEHQPGIPQQRAGIRSQAVRLQLADLRRRLQDQRLPCDARRPAAGAGAGTSGRTGQRAPAGTARRDQPGRAGADRLPALAGPAGAGRRGRRRGTAPAPGLAAVRRADQHPVHLRYHRLPQGRHPQPLQHPQQRLHGRRKPRTRRGRPPGDPGAAVSLLRHGDGQPRLRHPRLDHDLPGAQLRRRGDPAGRGRGARHRAVRVPTMFIAELDHPRRREFDLSSLRTGIMAGATCRSR